MNSHHRQPGFFTETLASRAPALHAAMQSAPAMLAA